MSLMVGTKNCGCNLKIFIFGHAPGATEGING